MVGVPATGSSHCLSVRVQVGWGDCDPAGIVFYPRFYVWMDTVSHVLAREMGASLSLRHAIVRLEPDGTETSIARGRENRVFIASGPDGFKSQPLTAPMRAVLTRFADPLTHAETDGLPPG